MTDVLILVSYLLVAAMGFVCGNILGWRRGSRFVLRESERLAREDEEGE